MLTHFFRFFLFKETSFNSVDSAQMIEKSEKFVKVCYLLFLQLGKPGHIDNPLAAYRI